MVFIASVLLQGTATLVQEGALAVLLQVALGFDALIGVEHTVQVEIQNLLVSVQQLHAC